MPTLRANLQWWDSDIAWTAEGDEWSEPWGTTDLLWATTILPRLQPHLPARRIVEIAPGRGRITRYLTGQCDELVGVDISPACVATCQQMFPEHRFEVTDGATLQGVEGRSADLVFSFDSLVHVDETVMRGYLREIERTLAQGGVGWLHHSNAANLSAASRVARMFPGPVARRLVRAGLIVNVNKARDTSVSAERVAGWAESAGLRVVAQEKISWGTGPWLTDCITVLTLPGSRWDREPVRWRNPQFTRDARAARRLARYEP